MADQMTDEQIDFLLLTCVKPEDAERHGAAAADVARRFPVLLEQGYLAQAGWIVQIEGALPVEQRRTLRTSKGATRLNELKQQFGE